MHELAELRNIGPVSARRLEAAGVASQQDLEALGAVEAYLVVKKRFPEHTSLNLLYALEGALLDIPWDEVPHVLRQRLREQANRTA